MVNGVLKTHTDYGIITDHFSSEKINKSDVSLIYSILQSHVMRKIKIVCDKKYDGNVVIKVPIMLNVKDTLATRNLWR